MKTAVCFLCHIFDDFALSQYNKLKESILHNQTLYWVHTTRPTNLFFKIHGIENDVYIEPRKNYFDKNNRNHPNNAYVFVDTFKKLEGCADFYTFIEYDVMINSVNESPFNALMNFLENDSYIRNYDLIADHISSYTTNHVYNIRYEFFDLRKRYPMIDRLNLTRKDIHFAFYSVCRFSKRFFTELLESPDYIDIFFEIGLTTFAYVKDMTIGTLHNSFSYDIQAAAGSNHSKINNGSNSYVIKEYKEYWENYPEGAIIHPVKKNS